MPLVQNIGWGMTIVAKSPIGKTPGKEKELFFLLYEIVEANYMTDWSAMWNMMSPKVTHGLLEEEVKTI